MLEKIIKIYSITNYVVINDPHVDDIEKSKKIGFHQLGLSTSIKVCLHQLEAWIFNLIFEYKNKGFIFTNLILSCI
jgi:hypothetical protein